VIGPRLTILVVDDDQGILDILTEHFAPSYDVETAVDGREAIELVRADRPDLIIVDMHMPGLTGIDVLQRVHEMWPLLPVVITCGTDAAEAGAHATRQGAFGYVSKPFDLQALDRLVAVALGR
jgi:DNA-binding NtrC family response regulator